MPREIQNLPNSKAYYVSIKDNLEVLLQNKSISETIISNLSNIDKNNQVANNHLTNECKETHTCNSIKSYRDGTNFKNSFYRQMKSQIIDVILYVDEFALCDASGKNDASHKALCSYFTNGFQYIKRLKSFT